LFFLNNLHTPRTKLWDGLKAIDWIGALSIVGGTVMFLLGLEFGGVTFPWNSATVVCLLVFGVVLLLFFMVVEWKLAPYPIIPLHVFSNRHNTACLLVCFFHGLTFIGASYYLPLFFQACRGATPILSGVYLLATVLSLSFTSLFTGIFINKTGQYLPAIWFGFILMTLGFGLFTDLELTSSWAKIILYQIIAGVGVGPNFQGPLIALQSNIDPRDIGSATSTFSFVRYIGLGIGVVLGGVVFQNEMEKQKPTLIAKLGPELGNKLSGFGAGASSQIVDRLPAAQRPVAQAAFARALHYDWIMYVCFVAAGLLCCALIRPKHLERTHQQTRTGLEAEKEKRLERLKGKNGDAAVPAADVEKVAAAGIDKEIA